MILVSGLLLVFLKQIHFGKTLECGYKQCPVTRDGALNVHIIPHSHMDAGWVKTFEEYYYGTKTSISTANVQLIYHSVLSELLHDKRRKFTFSETAYFWRWWKEQRGTTRATFRSLVAEGRIQFAGGGWVQADEATVDYLQLLDLYTWGLRKLNDTLGPCGKPKAIWQIDTYGHTREHTSLVAQMGFDGIFIGRVDHKEREAMIEEDRMEFMWRGSDVLGKMSDIMTHTLYNLYNAPEGFCFDFLCSDEPIVDDPDSKVFNADKRVNDFVTYIERQSKYYDHDNILVTMGGDFTYQSAANWFMNIDKLINHINTHQANTSDINIFYSSPACYLKAIYLYGRRDKAVYTEKGDHLPYGSDSNTYWTGFYTSRPSFKYFVKRAHIFLQILKQLHVLSKMGDSYELHLLRHAVSLVLHHDAITGTSQQHVTNDFVKILSDAIELCSKKISQFLTVLTPTWGGSRRPKNGQHFVICHQLNMSQCRFTENQDAMLLLVYNPLSVKTYYHVRLPAIALHYSIRDYNDEEVELQLVPLPTAIINLPGKTSTAIQELCFEAENIPPMGYTAYYITPIRDQLAEGAYAKKTKLNPDAEHELLPYITNEYLKVVVNQTTGLLESIQHVDGIKIMVSQNFYIYSQIQQNLQSGAYSFRPGTVRPNPVTEKVNYHTIRGILVKEIRQRFSDWITQIIRLYRAEEFVEMEWIIGPVPIGTDLGKEVVTIFKTNITSNGEFYTDSNSRQMMKRTCWNDTSSNPQKKPVQACYYPVTSRICLQSRNSSTEMCILTDRTQGGTSYNDGEIELMVHRRLLTDDGFGLEESLNEEAFEVGLVVKGKHRIFFGNFRQEVDDLSFSERASQMARRWMMEPWLFFSPGDKISRRKWQNIRNKRYTAIRLHGLPRHVQVLTLEPWKGGAVLLRLENTLEKPRGQTKFEKETPNEYNFKSSYTTVDLHKLFLHHKIKMVRETTLAANQWLEEARQMDWSTRYVYPGGDDGIMPEDNPDYIDNAKPRQTDTKDSDEDIDYPRQSPRYREAEKGISKIKQSFTRKRRSASENKDTTQTKVITERVNPYQEKYKKTKQNNNKKRRSRTKHNNTTRIKVLKDIFDPYEAKQVKLKPIHNKKIQFTLKNNTGTKLQNEKENNSPNKEKGVKDQSAYNRKRRSINTTENDNTTSTDVDYNRMGKIIEEIKNSTVANVTGSNKIFKKSNVVTKRTTKLSFLALKKKPMSFFVDMDKSEESSLENDSAAKKTHNFTKIRGRSKSYRNIVSVTEDLDDGITKSMYDMYYKSDKRRNVFKPVKSSEEKFKKRQARNEDSKEYTTRKYNRPRKGQTVGMQFFITNRGHQEDSSQYDDERRAGYYLKDFYSKQDTSRKRAASKTRKQERYSSYEDGSEEGDSDINRRKRAMHSDDQKDQASSEYPNDQDFVITLRPTQIRTFIIWFEEKRPYGP